MAPRTKKSVAPTEENVSVPVVETPVAVPVTEEPSPVVVGEESDVDAFVVVVEKLQAMSSELKSLLVTVKTLQKENAKLKKLSSKKKSRKCPLAGGAKVQSGFSKPTKISDALCDFFGITRGTELARTEVTKRITAYVKANNLQNPEDKRKINPDAKLKGILDIPEGVQLSFFNLQSCVKAHFIKA